MPGNYSDNAPGEADNASREADVLANGMSPLRGDIPDPESMAPSPSVHGADVPDEGEPEPSPGDVPATHPTEVPDEGEPEPGPADRPQGRVLAL